MFEVDPIRIRELAEQVRGRSETIASKVPVAVPARDEARKQAPESFAITRAQETMKALDEVLKFHAARMSGLADALNRAATEYEEQDRQRADELHRMGPR
ncbi:type VII secretion target [Nocardia sp. 004]|uniref:type VII secretion target n=1 Tax=Nocardia sp. 004 TaxID=3385978 RepID=UPI0039A2E74D